MGSEIHARITVIDPQGIVLGDSEREPLQMENHRDRPEMNKALSALYKMEKLAYDDAMFVPLWGVLFIAVDAPYVKDTVWFWGSMPYPNLESAWLDK